MEKCEEMEAWCRAGVREWGKWREVGGRENGEYLEFWGIGGTEGGL